jgi:hypothetical protein
VCIDPKAGLLKGANATIKQSGRSRIVNKINASRSIGDPVNLRRVVVEGTKAVAPVVSAPSGVALGAQGSGVYSGQYNSETGVADVRRDRETGSMIRKSEQVCVEATKCAK